MAPLAKTQDDRYIHPNGGTFWTAGNYALVFATDDIWSHVWTDPLFTPVARGPETYGHTDFILKPEYR